MPTSNNTLIPLNPEKAFLRCIPNGFAVQQPSVAKRNEGLSATAGYPANRVIIRTTSIRINRVG